MDFDFTNSFFTFSNHGAILKVHGGVTPVAGCGAPYEFEVVNFGSVGSITLCSWWFFGTVEQMRRGGSVDSPMANSLPMKVEQIQKLWEQKHS